MNRKSLITAGLVAVGLISAAVNSEASPTVVTVTGSTAFRAVVFTACTSPGVVFASHAQGLADSHPEVTDPSVVSHVSHTPDNNGDNSIVYDGWIKNGDGTYTEYYLDCGWTGSEAGIAAIAQVASIANPTPVFNGGTSPLPGVPPKYVDTNTLNSVTTAGLYPSDLAFADTSQAVSLTKNLGGSSPTALKSYGIVGIVPFVWMKGNNTAPTTSSWGHLTNITHPAAKLAMVSGFQPPRLFTGNTNDPDTDSVIVVGRNIGSGTHVNQMLDTAIGLTTPVDQYVINTTYSGSGSLTQGGVIAYHDSDVLEVGPDGFDSGSGVAACLKCDGKNSTFIPIGFLGLPDAYGLPVHSGGAEGSGAITLTLDGVTENNGAVENAQYTAWGHENLYGKHGQLTTDPGGIVGAHLFTGVPLALSNLGWGTTNSFQDAAIPRSLMHADKSGDIGYPAPQ